MHRRHEMTEVYLWDSKTPRASIARSTGLSRSLLPFLQARSQHAKRPYSRRSLQLFSCSPACDRKDAVVECKTSIAPSSRSLKQRRVPEQPICPSRGPTSNTTRAPHDLCERTRGHLWCVSRLCLHPDTWKIMLDSCGPQFEPNQRRMRNVRTKMNRARPRACDGKSYEQP